MNLSIYLSISLSSSLSTKKTRKVGEAPLLKHPIFGGAVLAKSTIKRPWPCWQHWWHMKGGVTSQPVAKTLGFWVKGIASCQNSRISLVVLGWLGSSSCSKNRYSPSLYPLFIGIRHIFDLLWSRENWLVKNEIPHVELRWDSQYNHPPPGVGLTQPLLNHGLTHWP